MVMTSRYEGFPMTLLEGLGNGLPLISFDIPTGPSEIIEDGKNGFLIKALDVDGMSIRLNEMMRSTDVLVHMSHNSREKAKVFSQEEIESKWNKELEAILH